MKDIIKKMMLVGCMVLSLSACKEVLYSNLSESDANEMLSTLLKSGVEAQKVSAGKNGFSIEVDEENLILALEIIKENSLPRHEFESLGTVFAGQGMIASQTEEQARFAYAISQELAATFSKIDGVLDARVHVVLTHHDQASGLTTAPSAAVFIRHTNSSPVTTMISSIKSTTANAVPGLEVSGVTVMTEAFSQKALAPNVKKVYWYSNPLVYSAFVLLAICLIAFISLIVAKKKGYRLIKDNKDNDSATTTKKA